MSDNHKMILVTEKDNRVKECVLFYFVRSF